MKLLRKCKVALVGFALLSLVACVDPNAVALQIGAPPVEEGETTTSLRVMQTRNFDTLDSERLVQAATATLQDLGFKIEAASPKFGVLAGSKDREALETGQVVGQYALAIAFALLGSSYTPQYDESQQINVTMVINQVGDKNSEVRVVFDRHLTNNLGVLWRAEFIKEPEIYQQFFENLSAATFLEANKI